MRNRILILALPLIAAAMLAAGCGSDPSGKAEPIISNKEAGTQAAGGFPGAGATNAPNVTTTAGGPPPTSAGKAGGGSGATCIGC